MLSIDPMPIPLAAAMVVFSVEFFAEVCVLEVVDAFSASKTVVLVSCVVDVRACVIGDVLILAAIVAMSDGVTKVQLDVDATVCSGTMSAVRFMSTPASSVEAVLCCCGAFICWPMTT